MTFLAFLIRSGEANRRLAESESAESIGQSLGVSDAAVQTFVYETRQVRSLRARLAKLEPYPVTASEVVERLGISVGAARNWLAHACREGHLERIGRGRYLRREPSKPERDYPEP